MRGYLMIFVDGYKTNSRHSIHILPSGHVVPDGLMQPTVHPLNRWRPKKILSGLGGVSLRKSILGLMP